MKLTNVNENIDPIDRKILNILLDNSRLSYRQIARKVGVSVVTVMNRVRELERKNVITAYTSDFDYEALGYDIHIIIKMRIAKGRLFEVEKKIASNPHVFAVYDVTGDFDALIIAKFKNRRSMDSFLKKLQTYEFVERTETIFILNTIKEKNIPVE